MQIRRFCDCGISEKWLYTSFLLVALAGYLMAMTYLFTSHQGHDGQPGVSIEDIIENYYGNRSGTRLEAAIRGPMAAYIQLEDRNEVVAWLKSGADLDTYTVQIKPIIEKSCTACHNPEFAAQRPDLTSYDSIGEVAQIDTGESLHTLMKLSHIHLFGIGLLLLNLGLIFRLTRLWVWIKIPLIVLPFAAIFADISAWFLTKWDPIYAYVVVSSGAIIGLCIVAQILISLYQIWFLRHSIITECE